MKTSKFLWLSAFVAALAIAGCGTPTSAPKAGADKVVKKEDDHDHGEGPHGGTIVEFGKLHAEFTVDHKTQEATVYILDSEVKKAVPIKSDQLLLSIKTPSFQVELKPAPLEGESKGQSSRFVATHANFGKEQEFEGTVSGEIDGKPYLGDFKEKPDHDKQQSHGPDDHSAPATPVVKAVNAEDQQLYLKPGGAYTSADVQANGNMVPEEKYPSFKAAHDIKPKPGDRLCPVTLTKANPALTWIIAGKEYEFCCLPCVEEYVKLAKEHPTEVKPPEAYLKK